jgi:hypothetical protein
LFCYANVGPPANNFAFRKGKRLARWAEKNNSRLFSTQGVALGWINEWAFGPKAIEYFNG